MTITSDIGPFAIVPRWVIRALAGKKWGLTLYCVLADHADRESSSWKIGRKALAAEMGCGLSTLQEAQAECVEAGCIRITPTSTPDGDQGWNSYHVVQIAPDPDRDSEGGRLPEQHPSTAMAVTLPRTPYKNPVQEPLSRELEAPSVEALFSLFWQQYPRKVSKPAALKAYRAAMKDVDRGAVAAEIMAGLQPWIRFWSARGEPEFIPHPSTWLNGHRWQDVAPAPVRRSGSHRVGVDEQLAAAGLVYDGDGMLIVQ